MSKLKALLLVVGFSAATFAAEPTVPLSPPATPATDSTTTPTIPDSQDSSAVPLTKSDVDVWLDGYVPYALRTADIPGVVVTIVKDGQILTARGFGYADRAKRTPVDPDRTLFRPGSVSKLITWTAAMQLVEQGKLDLDKDINTYLDFKIPDYDGKPITLRQLMTHTAGFEEAIKGLIFSDPAHLLPLGDYLKRWTPERVFAPGTTPAYSNWGTALTGYVVERVSGETFDDYCDKHIFAPLGMTNSTMRQPLPKELEGQMASGYKPGQDEAGKFEIVGPAPAGSLSSTGTDMAKFMIANLDGGKGLLSPETAAMMHNSPLDKVDPASLLPPLNRMELGYFETNVNGREVIGHLGDTEFFHTSLHLLMNEDVGVYFSFNSGGREGQVQTLRWSMFEDFADRYFPATTPAAAPIDEKTAAEHAAMMAGNWQVSRTAFSNPIAILQLVGQTKVAVGPKGLLIPELLGANKLPREWEEIAPFVWREKGGHDLLAAKVENGQVVRWSFGLLGPFMVFDRVPGHRSSSWLLPAASVAIGVLFLTVLFWPIGWFARRKYRAAFPLAGTPLRAYKWTRWSSLAVVLVLVGWMAIIGALFANLENTAGAFDTFMMVLQVVGLVVFVAAVAITGYNAWLTWRDGRKWTAKTWNTLIALSSCVLLYVAVTFKLVSMTVNY
jgi:CubicO group peptidase (beta-lactamase class C family)